MHVPACAACPLRVCAAAAVADLRALADGYVALAGSALPAHAHLGEDDRATLRKEAGDALSWLNEKVMLQSQVSTGRVQHPGCCVWESGVYVGPCC